MKKIKYYFINVIYPAIIIPLIVGFVVGIIVFFYKYIWDLLFKEGLTIYDKIIDNKVLILVAILFILLFSYIQTVIIKFVPESKGGGIPTSEGIVRGALSTNPYFTSVAAIFLSYISIFSGISLGSEGPSVLLGTTVSNMLYKLLPKSKRAYKRYIMTSGASTAFAIATGAPITGILFSLEEIHKKFSPMILFVTFLSVISGSLVDYFLSNKFGVSIKMFDNLNVESVSLSKTYIFILLGLIVGLFAILYSKLIQFFKYIIDVKTIKINNYFKILLTFLLSFIIGLILRDTLGGGHSLIEKLFEIDFSMKILIIYFLIKLILITYSSQSNVTGGLFVPTLTLGALIGAIFTKIFNLEEYKLLIISVSIVSFMGSSIGCPLSAILFAIETLDGINNSLIIIITIFISYTLFSITKTSHIYDIILERKLKNKYDNKDFLIIESNLIVSPSAFAIGKQTRDLLLPPNMKIIFIQRYNKDHSKMDNKGEKVIEKFDSIVIHAQTYDIDKTKYEIESFFGEQEDFKYNIIQKKIY